MALSEDDFEAVIRDALFAHPDSSPRALATAQRAVSRQCVQALVWPAECGGLSELAVEIAESISDLTPFANLPDDAVFQPHEHSREAFLKLFTAATEQAKRLLALKPHLLRAEGVTEAMFGRRLELFASLAATNEHRMRGNAARGDLQLAARGMQNFRRFCTSMLVTSLGVQRAAEFVIGMAAGNRALGRVMPLLDLPDNPPMN